MATQAKTTLMKRFVLSSARVWLVTCLLLPGCNRGDVMEGDGRASVGNGSGSVTSDLTELLVYGKVPSFQLTDQSGEAFASDMLNGQVYLATFFFTTCPTTCPQQSRALRGFQDIDGLSILSITVQPNVDTPDVLLRYSAQYQADLSKWHFLTGTRQEIWNLSQKGFMLPVGHAPEPGDMPIFHSSKVILVDRRQQIRGFYESQSRADMATLRVDARQLLNDTIEFTDAAAPQAKEVEDDELSALQDDLRGAFQAVDSNDTPAP